MCDVIHSREGGRSSDVDEGHQSVRPQTGAFSRGGRATHVEGRQGRLVHRNHDAGARVRSSLAGARVHAGRFHSEDTARADHISSSAAIHPGRPARDASENPGLPPEAAHPRGCAFQQAGADNLRLIVVEQNTTVPRPTFCSNN